MTNRCSCSFTEILPQTEVETGDLVYTWSCGPCRHSGSNKDSVYKINIRSLHNFWFRVFGSNRYVDSQLIFFRTKVLVTIKVLPKANIFCSNLGQTEIRFQKRSSGSTIGSGLNRESVLNRSIYLNRSSVQTEIWVFTYIQVWRFQSSAVFSFATLCTALTIDYFRLLCAGVA